MKKRKNPYNSTGVKDFWEIGAALVDASLVIERAKKTYTSQDAQELMGALWEWGKKDSSLFVGDFLSPLGLSTKHFKRIISPYRDLVEMYNTLQERLGCRQRYLALVGRIDAGMTKATLRHFLDEWKPSVLYNQEWKREDKHRSEDKKHQEKMAEIRKEQDSDLLREIHAAIADKKVEITIPELNNDQEDSPSRKD